MSKRDDGNVVIQDTAQSLGRIRDSNATPNESIVSAVLDIQRYAITRCNWIKSLECLYLTEWDDEPSGKRQKLSNGESKPSTCQPELLQRTYLDPVSDSEAGRDYVAVSYTWEPSEDEEEEDDGEYEDFGSYLVESRSTGQSPEPSRVRDVVWERVLHYAHHVRCDNIWIDRECIDQENSREKETAIQNMHMVYSLSRRPIALLTRAIQTVEELDLLVSLLVGDIREDEEAAALELLEKITSDLWWRRAWTFQEDYRASTRMTLLIPHTSNLEHRKQTARDFSNRPLLGTLPGEICIKSADLRRRATQFCLVYRQKRPEKATICDKVLTTAGKYDVLLQEKHTFSPYNSISRSMSPTIFADIGRRGITKESDRLAIAANCCGYTTRLDTRALNKDNRSLSLSMLALYLLNGEIIKNYPQRHHGALKDTVFGYLAKQSLHSFQPPVEEKLTFIKSCRFLDPILTYEGTQTRGHVWRLGKIIRPRPLKRDKFSKLSPLETLATDLQFSTYGKSYTELAVNLLSWVRHVSAANGRMSKYQCHSVRNPYSQARPYGWRAWMAAEVEDALREGKALRLASLVNLDDPEEFSPYSAIFVGDDAGDWKEDGVDDEYARPSYVFTSVRQARDHPFTGDISKHVSLEVELEWPEDDSDTERESEGETEGSEDSDTVKGPGLPRLYIKRWINGFGFWDGCPHQDVLFPWPADLLATA